MASNAIANKVNNAPVPKKNAGKTVKKDYVLNDLEALKKKLAHSTRSPEIEVASEAINGAKITNTVKTVLFDYD